MEYLLGVTVSLKQDSDGQAYVASLILAGWSAFEFGSTISRTSEMSDEAVKVAVAFSKLEKLELYGTSLTDVSLEYILKMENLIKIGLPENAKNSWIRPLLEHPKIVSLNFGCCKDITLSGVENHMGWRKIRVLDISNSGVSETSFLKHLDSLEILSANGCTNVDIRALKSDALKYFSANGSIVDSRGFVGGKSLEYLHFWNATMNSFVWLKNCTQLSEIDFRGASLEISHLEGMLQGRDITKIAVDPKLIYEAAEAKKLDRISGLVIIR
ncbi:MAG: hypothetical protein R3F19_27630 [Verrucomicrobiales bacterium]